MRKLLPLLIVLAGCRQVPMLPGITPHVIDIQQGNYVTQDMVAKLKPGMTKNQVRFALGTPLVVDPFHSDRWDYVYVMQKGGRVVEQRRIYVLFDDDRLTRIEGDVVPSALGATGSAASSASQPSEPRRSVEPARLPGAPEASDARKTPEPSKPSEPAEAPKASASQ